MSIFELLASLLEPFFDLVPRLAHRPQSNEVMVVDGLFGVRTRKRARVFIPAFCHINYYPTSSQPVDCGLQRLTTADGVSVAVNATAVYTIGDPVLMRSVFGDDYHELVAMSLRSYVCEYVSGHNFTYLGEVLDSDGIWNESAAELSESGIDLVAFMVEDLQEIIPLSLLQ